MSITINKKFTAYCPYEDSERTIKVEIICQELLSGSVSYGISNFQCPQMAQCHFINGNSECSFITEIIQQVHSQRNNF